MSVSWDATNLLEVEQAIYSDTPVRLVSVAVRLGHQFKVSHVTR